MLFSEHFGISRGRRDDWFDPILESDTQLWVDPFFIFTEKDKQWATGHATLIAHFDHVFMLLARSGFQPKSPYYIKAVSLLGYREPAEFCLGYTSGGVDGTGGGPGVAKDTARAMVAAIKRGIDHLDHFELLGVFNRGIGPDRIGDLTCSLLKPLFIEYTRRVAKRHGIPSELHELRYAGVSNDQWQTVHVELPTNPATGGPVLLTPERFLGRLPTLYADEWWEFHAKKAGLNIEVMEGADKAKIVSEALKNQKSVTTWVKTMEKDGGEPYDLDVDRDLVWRWEMLTLDFVNRNPRLFADQRSKKDFVKVIDEVIAQYQQFIENEGGWRHLWNDDGTEKHEDAAQNLFRGVAKHYCVANNISIDREVNLGRGPVDFKFSRGAVLKAHLEVKKLTSGGFWFGLASQLPDYMRSDEVVDGWYLAIQLRTGGVSKTRPQELPAEVARVAKERDLRLRFGLVDGRPKQSASKKPKP
jgi:hypothetical protein